MTTATATPTTIHELQKFDGPIYIANNGPDKITFHEAFGHDRVDFELDPHGHPDSVMILPKLALNMRGLQKLWSRNAITISTDPSFQDTITLLLNGGIQSTQQRLDAVMTAAGGQATAVSVEQPNTANALVVRPCLVCGHTDPQTGVIDRGQVTMSQFDAAEGTKPLCDAHQSQAADFIPRSTPNPDGTLTWSFDRVSLTPTERS